jgi:hypothetical protein
MSSEERDRLGEGEAERTSEGRTSEGDVEGHRLGEGEAAERTSEGRTSEGETDDVEAHMLLPRTSEGRTSEG